MLASLQVLSAVLQHCIHTYTHSPAETSIWSV